MKIKKLASRISNDSQNAMAAPARGIAERQGRIAPPPSQTDEIAPHPHHPIEQLQSAIGNRAVNQLLANQPTVQAKPMFRGLSHELIIQPKLTIGAVGDKYEQEADWVAANVVDCIHAPQSSVIQRGEMPEDDEELPLSPTIQHVAENRDTIAASPDLEASINQEKGRGESIPQRIRQPIENVLGTDFSEVKVHTDDRSHQLNRSIQSKAFTTGKDIFFRQGAYNPGSRGGQELIAHELTHVVQQNSNAIQYQMQTLPSNITQTTLQPQLIQRTKDHAIELAEIYNPNGEYKYWENVLSNKKSFAPQQWERIEAAYRLGPDERLVTRDEISVIQDRRNTEATPATKAKAATKAKQDPSIILAYQRQLSRGAIFRQTTLANRIHKIVEGKMQDWAGATNGVAVLAPIKSLERILEKMQAKAKEKGTSDWSSQIDDVKDILRGSILYKDMASLYNGAIRINQSMPAKAQADGDELFIITKANELFTNPKLQGGYRDIKIVFIYQRSNIKIPVELQLNLAQNVVVKEGKQFSRPLKRRTRMIPNWFDTRANYQSGENFNVRKYRQDLENRTTPNTRIPQTVRQRVTGQIKDLDALLINVPNGMIPLSHKIYEREQQGKPADLDALANKIYKLLFDIEQMLATPETGQLKNLRSLGFDDANPPRQT